MKLRLLNRLAPIIIFVVDLALFHQLLFNSYIAHFDFSTTPQFIKVPPPLLQLAGFSYSFPYPFGNEFAPGITILSVSFYIVFGNFSTNVISFLALYVFSYGLFYLSSRFTDKALLITVLCLLTPAVLNDVNDAPLTLYLWSLPLFTGLYLQGRVKGSLSLVLSSLIPLTLSSAYGPYILSLLASIIAVELYVHKLKGLYSFPLALGTFSISHINLILNYSSAVHSLFVNPGVPEHFRNYTIIQSLTYLEPLSPPTLAFPGQLYYTIIPKSLFLISFWGYLILSVILLYFAFSRNKYFSLIFLILVLAIMGYGSNYLGVYSVLEHTFPFFMNVSPYEYEPLISMWIAIALSEILGFGRASIPLWTTLTLMIVLSSVTGAVMIQYLSSAWSDVHIPKQFENAYVQLKNSSGTIMVIPQEFVIQFKFDPTNYTLFGRTFYMPGSPPNPFYNFPPSFEIYPSNSPLCCALEDGNYTKFDSCADNLDLEYVLYINRTAFIDEAGSSFMPTLDQVLDATHFVIYRNYSGEVYILENPNYTESFEVKPEVNGLLITGVNAKSVISRFYSGYSVMKKNNGFFIYFPQSTYNLLSILMNALIYLLNLLYYVISRAGFFPKLLHRRYNLELVNRYDDRKGN
ncbi:hypothetical protein HS7_00180 [Sulfolobales archaeon HS-7]|nr:hypothetical protein HS7_00180 [Sulfolobales archaeon HS-7]